MISQAKKERKKERTRESEYCCKSHSNPRGVLQKLLSTLAETCLFLLIERLALEGIQTIRETPSFFFFKKKEKRLFTGEVYILRLQNISLCQTSYRPTALLSSDQHCLAARTCARKGPQTYLLERTIKLFSWNGALVLSQHILGSKNDITAN